MFNRNEIGMMLHVLLVSGALGAWLMLGMNNLERSHVAPVIGGGFFLLLVLASILELVRPPAYSGGAFPKLLWCMMSIVIGMGIGTLIKLW